MGCTSSGGRCGNVVRSVRVTERNHRVGISVEDRDRPLGSDLFGDDVAVGDQYEVGQVVVKFLACDEEAGADRVAVEGEDAGHGAAPQETVLVPLEVFEACFAEHGFQVWVSVELSEALGVDVA